MLRASTSAARIASCSLVRFRHIKCSSIPSRRQTSAWTITRRLSPCTSSQTFFPISTFLASCALSCLVVSSGSRASFSGDCAVSSEARAGSGDDSCRAAEPPSQPKLTSENKKNPRPNARKRSDLVLSPAFIFRYLRSAR